MASESEDLKTCKKCGTRLPRSAFHRNKMTRDGLQPECKACKSARQKALYRAPKMEGAKACRTCGETKVITEFHAAPTYEDGRKPDCATCHGEADRRLRTTRPAELLVRHAKVRAKAKNIPFTLRLTDVHVPTTCPVLDIPLFTGRGKFRENSPSLDRINPVKGYVPGNVRVISWRANRLKGDATLEEIRAVLRYMEES